MSILLFILAFFLLTFLIFLFVKRSSLQLFSSKQHHIGVNARGKGQEIKIPM